MTTREQDIIDLNALAELQQDKSEKGNELSQLEAEFAIITDKSYQIKVDYLPTDGQEQLQNTFENYLSKVNQKRINWLTAFCVFVCLVTFVFFRNEGPLFFILGPIIVIACVVCGSKYCKTLQKRDKQRIESQMKDKLAVAQAKDQQAKLENAKRREKALSELEERKKKLLEAIFDARKVVDDYTYLIGRNRMSAILSGNDAQYASFLAQQMESGRADTLKEALLLLDRKRENDERTAREERWRREDLARREFERAEEIERHRREREEDLRREEAYRQEQDRRYRESVERQEKQYRESQENMERNRREDIARQERQRRDMEYEMDKIRRELQN